MIRVFASIPKVKGSNFMGGVVCGQQGMLIECSFIGFLGSVLKLIMWPTYLLKLGFFNLA